MKKICIYGKGGIGKSTTVSNVAAAMAEKGLSVAVVGCDPKADSTRSLTGKKIPTVLDSLRSGQTECLAFQGYLDILCIEAGGPEPGTGCAGRGIIAAIREIRERELLNKIDAVIYDVLGDVVCGGFSMPLREGVADEIYLVTTADFMSLYAANNICRGIRKYAQRGSIRLAGVIYNARSSMDNPGLVEDFAHKIGTQVIGKLPMSELIAKSELARQTVLERYPKSEVSNCFRRLSDMIMKGKGRCIPTPLTDEEVEKLCRHQF
ncbi:MAG: P-loop NTPase [Chloroflexi bacterium]|nr:P-loop NTPase [Chloroflexota bacterium]